MTPIFGSIFARCLRRVARAVCQYRKALVYPQILLALACLFYAARGLKLDLNRDHLIGSHSEFQRTYLHFREEFPSGDQLIVVVRSDNFERNRRFIERLAARVAAEPKFFKDVYYKKDLTTLGPKALSLVSIKNLEQMQATLHEVRPLVQQFSVATNLESLFSLVNAQFFRAGAKSALATGVLSNAIPFLRQIVEHGTESLTHAGVPPPLGLEALVGGQELTSRSTYFTFAQGEIYLLTAGARSEPLTADAIVELRRLVQETQYEVPGVNVGLTGQPVLDYDEARQAEHDSVVASLVALVLCALVFVGAYKEIGRPIKAALCLLIGLGYTLGFTTLVVGHLNLLTVTFAPMLIGLAIDFGVHLSTRYEEEMRKGRSELQAVELATIFTGQGILGGALITIVAFLAMMFTQFKGVQEMGLIAGGGLVLCLVPMLTVLPVWLMHGRRNLIDRQMGPARSVRVRLENLWLRYPLAVVVASLLLCVFAARQAQKVWFDFDLLRLQSPGLGSVETEKLLIRSAERSVLFAAVVADTPEESEAFAARLRQLPDVASVESVADYFTEDQNRKREIVQGIKTELAGLQFAPLDTNAVQVESLSGTLWSFMGYCGLAANAMQTSLPELAAQLRSLRIAVAEFRKALLNPQNAGGAGRPQLAEFQRALLGNVRATFQAILAQDTSQPLRTQDLPPSLRDRFIGVTGKYLLEVYPAKDIWQHQNQRDFIRSLQSVIPAARVTGAPVQIYEYTRLLKETHLQAAAYALCAVIVMVLIHFRSFLCVVLALLPVGVGAVWLLGYMGLAGVSFNPINILALPLLVGIGITNGIQILNRFSEEREAGILGGSTGKAVLVSNLTAIAGFASLTLAQHQGISSLGEVMAVGIAGCMLAGLTALPALLTILHKAGWKISHCSARPPSP